MFLYIFFNFLTRLTYQIIKSNVREVKTFALKNENVPQCYIQYKIVMLTIANFKTPPKKIEL